MERRQRITFAAIALLIAVVAVIVLAGGGGDEDAGERAATATPTPAAIATGAATPQATGTPAPAAAPVVPEIRVRDGEVQGGVEQIEADKGDTVRFVISADVADHAHLHGYDVLRDVSPGKPAGFRFKADIPGIFEVELEESGIQVARLRVNP